MSDALSHYDLIVVSTDQVAQPAQLARSARSELTVNIIRETIDVKRRDKLR